MCRRSGCRSSRSKVKSKVPYRTFYRASWNNSPGRQADRDAREYGQGTVTDLTYQPQHCSLQEHGPIVYVETLLFPSIKNTNVALLDHADSHKFESLHVSNSHILRPLLGFRLPIIMAYCDRCDRWFSRLYALEQHKESSRFHWPCNECDIDFKTQDAQRQHFIQSQKHFYCEECDRPFDREVSRRQHMVDRHWYCRTHDQVSSPHHH